MGILLPRVMLDTITLSDKVRVSDPCYNIDTWCAGTLENVLAGTYQCSYQKSDEGDWGIRMANIEVRHTDYSDVEPTELQKIDVGVDSGQCGIYDLPYFIKAREDKDGEDKWYDRVCDKTFVWADNPNYIPFHQSAFWQDEFNTIKERQDAIGVFATQLNLNETRVLMKESMHEVLTEDEQLFVTTRRNMYLDIPNELLLDYLRAEKSYRTSKTSLQTTGQFAANTMDDKCLVSSSGDGDGSYHCLVGRNDNGQIVSIKIDYYYYGDDEDEE